MANRGGSEIVKEGYLTKSPPPDKALAHWHKRFFVLWSSRVMEYYSSSNKKPQEYLKTIDLTNCDDLVAPVPMKRPNVFKLTIRDREKVRDYLFECESKEHMDDWVKHLVEVLEFTTDEDESEQNSDPSTTNNHNNPKSRPRLPTPPKGVAKVFPPKPPPKPIQLEDKPEEEYIVPQVIINEDNYHVLSPTEPEGDVPQPYYEDMDFGEDDLFRRNPPPAWKKSNPPPLPTRPVPRRWKRSLSSSCEELISPPATGRAQNHGPEFDSKVKLRKGIQRTSYEPNAIPRSDARSPTPTHQPFDYEASVPTMQQITPPVTKRMDREPGSSKKPPPPVKPKHAALQGGVGFSLQNDPKFSRKLQERREEIYGGPDRVCFTSESADVSGDTPLDEYEEVLFTADANNDEGALRMVENDEGYVDVEQPDEPEDFYCERPTSPLFSTGPPLPPRNKTDVKHSSNPSLHRQIEVPAPVFKKRPALRPPIGTGKPSFSDRSSSVSPEPLSTFPPQDTRRTSLPNSPTSPIHSIPVSSRSFRGSPTPPPALPSRELIRPPGFEDLSRSHAPKREQPPLPTPEENTTRRKPPLPLPQDNTVSPRRPREPPMVPSNKRRPPLSVPQELPVAQPSLPKRDKPVPPSLREETTDSPPPIPRRHPQHSDRQRVPAQSGMRRSPAAPEIDNVIPLPPRGKSPIEDSQANPQGQYSLLSVREDDAPPVPHRGLRPLKSNQPRPISDTTHLQTRNAENRKVVRTSSSPPPVSTTPRKPQPPPKPGISRPIPARMRNTGTDSPPGSPPRHKPKPKPKPKPTLLPKPPRHPISSYKEW